MNWVELFRNLERSTRNITAEEILDISDSITIKSVGMIEYVHRWTLAECARAAGSTMEFKRPCKTPTSSPTLKRSASGSGTTSTTSLQGSVATVPRAAGRPQHSGQSLSTRLRQRARFGGTFHRWLSCRTQSTVAPQLDETTSSVDATLFSVLKEMRIPLDYWEFAHLSQSLTDVWMRSHVCCRMYDRGCGISETAECMGMDHSNVIESIRRIRGKDFDTSSNWRKSRKAHRELVESFAAKSATAESQAASSLIQPSSLTGQDLPM